MWLPGEAGVETLQVRRWTKGRHDRLYMSTRGGIKVGWIDLRTQQHQLDVPGMWPEFQAAVTRWKTSHPGPSATAPQYTAPEYGVYAPTGFVLPEQRPTSGRQDAPRRPRRQPVDLAEDLAGRKAGHNAAAMAQQLRPQHRALRVLAALVGWRTRDRSWKVGAAGEAAVGRRLDRLTRRGWRVLHAVSLGSGGDLDHLLIGPPGVFVVNTKHHPGALVAVGRDVVFVRGKPTPYVGKAHREADLARTALSRAWDRHLHVGPVLVFHGHRRVRGWIRGRPRGVQVLPSGAVAWWCRLPGRATLSAEDVERLYALARRPATWATV